MDTPSARPVAGSAYGGEGHPGRAGRLAGCSGGGLLEDDGTRSAYAGRHRCCTRAGTCMNRGTGKPPRPKTCSMGMSLEDMGEAHVE